MPLARVTNLVNGNVVDAPELNSEFNNIINAFNNTNAVDITVKAASATLPALTANQQSSGPIVKFQQAASDKVQIVNSGQLQSLIADGTAPITTVSTTVCTNLNADRIDGIEGSNIAKLDTNTTSFSLSWFIPDPSTAAGGIGNRGAFPVFVVPAGTAITITTVKIVFGTGTHTSGGVVAITAQRSTEAGLWDDWTTIGTATLSDTNNAPLDVYTSNVADVPLTTNDIITIYLDRANTITERNVTFIITGTQKLT